VEASASHYAVELRAARPAGGGPRRLLPGLAIVAGGLAPFLVAGLAWQRAEGEISGVGLMGGCPMLETLGIPCVGCGGARSFFHLTHGDAAFLDFNWFWPLAAMVAIAYGVVLLTRAARGREVFGPRARSLRNLYATRPAVMALATLAFFALPWLVAFGNLDSIKGG
jgi:hypothetical protein